MKAIIAFLIGGIVGGATVGILSKENAKKEPPSSAPSSSSSLAQGPANIPSKIVPREIVWPEFSLNDCEAYVGFLNEIGCPRSQIESLVTAEITKAMFDLFVGLSPTNTALFLPSGDLHKEFKKVKAERINLLVQLFGDEILDLDYRFGTFFREDPGHYYLPAQIRAEVARIIEGENEAIAAIRERSRGFLSQSDKEEIREIQKKSIGLLEATMPPDLYHTFSMGEFCKDPQNRQTFQNLEFNMNEIESVFEFTLKTRDLQQNDSALLEQSNNLLIQKIGPDRFAHFMRSRDPTYREVLALTKRFGLPVSTADEMVALKNQTLMNRNSARNPSYPIDQVEALLSDYQKEVKAEVLRVLGPGAGNLFLNEADGAIWAR